MADIKRLNYFNTQYLEQDDFKDEQKYHLEMRRLHNQRFHTPGIAYGLTVTKTGAKSITVSPGMALDNKGQEIVQLESFAINLSDSTLYPTGSTVYVTIAYDENATDPQPKDTPVPRGMTRITEKPIVRAIAVPPNAVPPTDRSVIQLANFQLDNQGNVPGQVGNLLDGSVRVYVGAVLGDNAVSIQKLKKELKFDETVTLDAGGTLRRVAFTTNQSSPSSAFLLIYAYSTTPGAKFSWTQEYVTKGTLANYTISQEVVFKNESRDSNGIAIPISINHRIYAVLES